MTLRQQELVTIRSSMRASSTLRLHREEAKVQQLSHRLAALSPFAVLSRGYAVATLADGQVVRAESEVQDGTEVFVRVHEGQFRTVRTNQPKEKS